MTVVPNSDITIGRYRFKGVYEVTVKKSVHNYCDTAVIKVPATSFFKVAGRRQTQSQQTAKQFKKGDKVIINLGYNGNLKREFIGFVDRVNFTTPVEIECEGYSYQLRNRKNIAKSWKATTLKEVLQEVVKDTDVKLHSKIPDIPLKNIFINNASGTQVIDYLKGLLKGALTACFVDDVFYMGLTYMDLAEKTVKFQLGKNTIKDEELKYHQAEDVKVNIELQFRKEGGQQVTTSTGTKGGVVRRDTLTAVTDEKHLKEIAQAKLLQESWNGYEGKLTAFLVPFVQPGYRAELTDPRYDERKGNYFVESTEVQYGLGGARRLSEIGIRLS